MTIWWLVDHVMTNYLPAVLWWLSCGYFKRGGHLDHQHWMGIPPSTLRPLYSSNSSWIQMWTRLVVVPFANLSSSMLSSHASLDTILSDLLCWKPPCCVSRCCGSCSKHLTAELFPTWPTGPQFPQYTTQGHLLALLRRCPPSWCCAQPQKAFVRASGSTQKTFGSVLAHRRAISDTPTIWSFIGTALGS